MTRSTAVRSFASALLLALAACHAGPGPADTPDYRPSDGLLERPDLQALVAAQIRRDAPTLIQAIRSRDPVLRARAAFALGSVQSREAAPAVETLLKDTAAAVRRDAAFALGQAGDTLSQTALLHALDVEGTPEIRRTIMDAIGRTGGSRALRALTDRPAGGPLWGERTLAIARLVLAGRDHPAASDSLARWLGASDDAARFHAAWMFARQEDPAAVARYVPRIREALDAYVLGEPAGMHLLTALGRFGTVADTTALLLWLDQGRDWRLKVNAARALEGHATEQGVQEGLLDALGDASVHVRAASAEVLAAAPPSAELVEAVERWVQSHGDDWPVAGRFLPLLARAGRGDAVLEWADRWPLDASGPWNAASEALMVLRGDGARERLARAAASDDLLVSTMALRALALRWSNERSRPGAAEAYWQVFSRAAASAAGTGLAAAAGVLGDSIFVARGSVPLLLDAWRRTSADDDPAVSTSVLMALGASRAPDAEPALRSALASPDARVADGAAQALLVLSGEPADTASPVGRRDPRAARERTVEWAFLAELGLHPVLVLETEEGRVEIVLATEEAPVTVQTVARLAREGRYDGVPFHRVVENFVVQGGDVGRGNGTGGPGFSIPSELTSLRFRRGTLGMASAGKDTEGSQFFITHSPQPHLDGGYTAFGAVAVGMDVVDRLVRGQRVLTASVIPGS